MTTLPAYDDEGGGPAVVLLHAGVADRRMWDTQAAVLRSSRRVVRPDLRGFGETPMPPGEFSFADDVVALLDALEIQQAALVAASMGGPVALEIAATWPERVSSLVLLCSDFRGLEPPEDVTSFGDEEDELLEGGDIDGAVELNVRTWLGPEASAGAAELVRQMQRHAFEVQLAADEQDPPPQPVRRDVTPSAIAAPTLVVSGAHDLAHFQRIAHHLAASIPRANHRHLDWAGHLPSLERPDETAA
ncbi:MAG TPA: alpha/beta fold hydrolase, partial [Pedococcus sp.]|nr:alpha/beta fold hydrolase [Pedococcus sp.]